MAPYRNIGQTSGFEPYDMNSQPAANSNNNGTTSPTTPSGYPPSPFEHLRGFQRELQIQMDQAPRSAEYPPGSEKDALQAVEKKMYSLWQNANNAVTYALENHDADPGEALKRLDTAREEMEEFQRCIGEEQERRLRGSLDDDVEDEDPLAPEAMRKLQGIVRGMRAAPWPTFASGSLEKQQDVIDLREESLLVCDQLDEAARYGLEHGRGAFHGTAAKKLRQAYGNMERFKERFSAVGRKYGLPTTNDAIKEVSGHDDEEGDISRNAAMDRFVLKRDALLKNIDEQFDAMLAGCPANETGTTDPETLQMNDFQDELRAFLKEFKTTTIYALQNSGPEGDSSRARLEEMQVEYKEYMARVKDYRDAMPPRTISGFVRYRMSFWSWKSFGGWLWARNKSVLFVAFTIFLRAYQEGNWIDAANGVTLVLNC